MFFTSLSLIITIFVCKYMPMDIKLEDIELQNNILKFEYGIKLQIHRYDITLI